MACCYHVFEVVALLTVKTSIGGYKDIAVAIGTELSEDKVLTIGEVSLERLAIITDQSLLVCDHPEKTVLIFEQRIDSMDIGKNTTQLASRLLVGQFHHTKT